MVAKLSELDSLILILADLKDGESFDYRGSYCFFIGFEVDPTNRLNKYMIVRRSDFGMIEGLTLRHLATEFLLGDFK